MTAAATENGGNQPPTLLVVEDDALILDVIRIELNDAGFEIVVARNGAEALSELDADATRFKAVISDIRLGEGPNGWDVGRHARELVSDMPVVYISGDSGHEWSARGVPDSVLITKPFAPAQLITAVSTLVTSTDTAAARFENRQYGISRQPNLRFAVRCFPSEGPLMAGHRSRTKWRLRATPVAFSTSAPCRMWANADQRGLNTSKVILPGIF